MSSPLCQGVNVKLSVEFGECIAPWKANMEPKNGDLMRFG